jgi:hypothetical protein
MSTFDRLLCLVGAHRWANAVDPETGALFEKCVTCGRETDTAPWARGGASPGSPRSFGGGDSGAGGAFGAGGDSGGL